MRDNPVAIAEGATGAPVLSAAWHPYDMVNVGDGATGVIYDFAVNGAQASVTVNFEDGYDYLIHLIGISPSVTSRPLRINTVSATGLLSSADTLTGTIEIIAPTLPNLPKWAMCHLRITSGSTGPAAFSAAAATPFYGVFAFSNMATALNSVVLDFGAANIDAGKVLLYRRRNFMFG